MADAFFRLDVTEIGLSIEQNTENVPHDGRYHVVKAGVVVASYPSLKRARDRLQKLKEEAGYQPSQNAGAAEKMPAKEHVERLMDAASSYWGASHKFRGGGGKGGRGGI